MKIRFTFDLSQAEAHPGRRELAELYDLSLIENLETAEPGKVLWSCLSLRL